MGFSRHFGVRLGLTTVLLALAGAAPALASYDDLNGETLSDTPYTSAAPFDATTPVFDTASFTTDPGETGFAPQFLACSDPDEFPKADWGSKTAWVRFATAVEGRVRVSVDSSHSPDPGHDVFYKVFTAPIPPTPGSASHADMSDVECQNRDNNTDPDEDYVFGYLIPANRVIYVEVLAVCERDIAGPAYPCSAQEQADADGGPTSIRVRFTPTNSDTDDFPDTFDDCDVESGPFQGCPDGDGDGVRNPDDACPTVPGRAANGCRLPDEDGDGYRADAGDPRARDCNDDLTAIHPGAAEIRDNDVDENCDGFVAFDRDQDGVDDRPGPDCDPSNRKIKPGARDIPGNKKDEDCDGRDARFPRVNSEVAPSYLALRGRTVGFAEFGLLPVVRGMRIRIECRGAGCPYSARDHKVKRSRSKLVLGREFRRRTLPVGAKVTIKIMRPGYIGRVLRFTIRSGRGKPRIQKLCLRPGTTRPVRRRC